MGPVLILAKEKAEERTPFYSNLMLGIKWNGTRFLLLYFTYGFTAFSLTRYSPVLVLYNSLISDDYQEDDDDD